MRNHNHFLCYPNVRRYELIDRFIQGLSALFLAVRRKPVIRFQRGSEHAQRLADGLYSLTYKQVRDTHVILQCGSMVYHDLYEWGVHHHHHHHHHHSSSSPPVHGTWVVGPLVFSTVLYYRPHTLAGTIF